MSDNGYSSSGSIAIRSLNINRRHHASASPSHHSSPELSLSTFDPNPDNAIMSTRHNIEDDDNAHVLPNLRATAQKYNRGYYNPSEPQQPNPPTSAVNQQFQDFDHSYSSSDEHSQSIEVGRGMNGRSRNTPSKADDMRSSLLMDMGNNNSYEVTATPPLKHRSALSLRREAATRRASNKYSQQANGHSALLERNGNAVAGSPRLNRVEPRPRDQPLAVESPRDITQSYILPNLPNITELISGNYNDGTPIFSRSGKDKSRYISASYRALAQPTFAPVTKITLPDEEKAIFASLQLLKDKVILLEQSKADSDRKIEEYENEIIELRAQRDSRDNLRRSDSALGSTDGEGGGNGNNWKEEKTRLEASVQSLQKRLERSEKKVSIAESSIKRITQERDSVVTQLGVAFYSSEDLKSGLETARNENRLLQDQVTDLQAENHELKAENEELRNQLDLTHDRHDDETQRWSKKEAVLNRKATTTDRAIYQENQTLRENLEQLRLEQEEERRQATHKEAEIRRKAEMAAKAEHAKLAMANEQLKVELEQAKATREAEMKRWASHQVQQAKLKARVERQDETRHHMNAATPQDQVNEELRQQNEDLKVQLAKIKAELPMEQQGTPKAELRRKLDEVTSQRVNQTELWSRKETRLRDQIDRAREANNINREIIDIRNDTRRDTTGASKSQLPTDVKSKRKSTGQIGTNIHDSISEQIEREVQKNRSASAAQPRSRSKSQSRRALRPDPPRNLRHSSAPAIQDGDLSDASTTDLSFEHVITGTTRTNYMPATSAPAEEDDMMTDLSFISPAKIAALRKTLEEERIAERRRNAAKAAEDNAPKANSTRNLTQKSSLKDLTGRSKASNASHKSVFHDVDFNDESSSEKSENEVQHTKQDTIRSNLSRNSQRQRHRTGGFNEMTSAFILPDITLHGTARSLLDKLATPHNTTNCTVCQRIIGSSLSNINVPTPVPVSTRPEIQADIDATLRPTQGPVNALAKVMKELQDELHHLKLEFHVVEQKLLCQDPALGKRARKGMHEKLNILNKAIETKSDQIYALYDVLEAHKDEIHAGVVPEEIERTMESIRVAGKKVAFGARADDGEESEEEPWAGISDTEDLRGV